MNNKLFTKPTGFGQIIDGTVARCPEREAIVYKDWRITYGEMGKLINQTARYLRSLGLAKGSRLSVISRNCPECLLIEIAALKLGIIPVRINWRLSPEEMEYIIDLNDVNMIDPFHLEAYGKTAVNYNRDIEIFPVVNAMFELIAGKSPYHSPTDMGVNMAGNCIIDDEAVKEAANQEIIRRFFNAKCNQIKGRASKDEIYKLELLMNNAGLCVDDRKCALEATRLEEKTGAPAAAIELSDGKTVTGKTSALLGCASAMLLNALKVLAGIDDDVLLIAPEVIKPIQELKINHLGNKNPRLHTDETLIALSISAVNDEKAKLALNQISKLKNCEMHSSVMLAQVDENVLKKLGIRLTCSC